MAGLIPRRGKLVMTRFLALNVTHAGIGRGNWPDPFSPPAEDYNAGGLVDEIGRVPITKVRYLIQDVAGTIHFDGDPASYRYATDSGADNEVDAAAADGLAPSDDVEFEFQIPEGSATDEVVGQIALFINAATTVPGWAIPTQVTTPGHPYYLVNIKAKTIEATDTLIRRVRLRVGG